MTYRFKIKKNDEVIVLTGRDKGTDLLFGFGIFALGQVVDQRTEGLWIALGQCRCGKEAGSEAEEE